MIWNVKRGGLIWLSAGECLAYGFEACESRMLEYQDLHQRDRAMDMEAYLVALKLVKTGTTRK